MTAAAVLVAAEAALEREGFEVQPSRRGSGHRCRVRPGQADELAITSTDGVVVRLCLNVPTAAVAAVLAAARGKG